MKSMTGFGHGEAELEGKKVVIDIKSVNGRFLDLQVKMPKSFLKLEDFITCQIKKVLSRGSVDVFVNIFKGENNDVQATLNKELCENIYNEALLLSEKSGIPNEISVKDLLKIDGVLKLEVQETNIEEFIPLISLALNDALLSLNRMREDEGDNLRKDLTQKVNDLSEVVQRIEREVPLAINTYREKLTIRIKEALREVTIDEDKLLNEVAFFVDKSDINEEITRLYSHIAQIQKLMDANVPVGKQLEFISQEVTREINTTGSKSGSSQITSLVLSAKNINESIKEQIRNVE